MRRAALVAAVLALAVGGTALAVTAASGGGDGAEVRAPAALTWDGRPRSIEPEPGLEDDHILMGRLRNTSLRPAELDVERVRVRDADGRPLKTAARFSHHFAHGIYSPEMIHRDGPPGDFERRRLGEIATVRPGTSVPLTVSWRGDGAAVVDLGGTTVRIPAR